MSDEPACHDDSDDDRKAGRPPRETGEVGHAGDAGEEGDAGEGALGVEGDEEEIEIVGYTAADVAGVPIPDVKPPRADEEEEILIHDDFGDEPAAAPGEGSGLEGDFEAPDGPSVGVGLAEHAAALARLRQADARIDELRDRLLRTTADFENFRKRVDRDRAEERRQAAAGLVREMLPVLDNFERALAQAAANKTPSEAFSAFVEGVRLIQAQLSDILRRAGLDLVEADGSFDPNLHEALMQEITTEAPHLAIREVFERGYRFQGRLLRPARVKVAHNPDRPDAHGAAAFGAGRDDEAAAGSDEVETRTAGDGPSGRPQDGPKQDDLKSEGD
jgi:molecular chaperone GrpE